MNKNKFRSLPCLIVLVCLSLSSFPTALLAQRQAPPRANASRSRQKLVLVIMIDQFRYDFIERFWDLFGSNGFRRLAGDGAFFTNANFDYVPTVTAAGHAPVHTGSIPAINGVNGNVIVDRETGGLAALVADKESRLVTNAGVSEKATSASPRTLIGTTIGDQIRLSNNFQSKVVSLSQKDRAAVLPGGKRPNGAFWFDAASGGTFVSSDYYGKELPAWVKQFNTSTRPDKYFGAKWERALPAEAYRRAMDATNWPQIYPLGFLPLIEPRIADSSLNGGMRGELATWFYDASVGYGRNTLDYYVRNSLNASLGPTSQTSFYAGALGDKLYTVNVDLSKGFNVGLAGPVNLAGGVEYRREGYEVKAGEPNSYIHGGVPNQLGGIFQVGKQHGDLLPFAFQRATGRENFLREIGWGVGERYR